MALIAAARGLYFLAAMLLFGGEAFAALLRARLPAIAPVKMAAPRWAAWAVALVAGCAWAGLAAMQMADALDSQVMVRSATDTLFGQLFLARMAALVLLAAVFALMRGHRLAALIAAALLVLPAATSHAAVASPAGFIAIGGTLDAVHLLTAGFWIGGLMVLALLFARKEPNILLALSLFSDWALVAVLLLVMTGMIDALQVLLGNKGAMAPPYLAVLGAKLLLVIVMLGLAAVNKFKLMPKADDRTIARNAAFELGLGAIVVLLAGALGQLQPVL